FEPAPERAAVKLLRSVIAVIPVVGVTPIAVAIVRKGSMFAAVLLAPFHAVAKTVVVRAPLDVAVRAALCRVAAPIAVRCARRRGDGDRRRECECRDEPLSVEHGLCAPGEEIIKRHASPLFNSYRNFRGSAGRSSSKGDAARSDRSAGSR